MKRSSGFVQGKFRPINREKYRGDPDNITFRSSWELVLARRFDEDSRILSWSSEEDVVNYRSPVDNRMHRYFIDFSICARFGEQGVQKMFIEVKPFKETQEPKRRASESEASYLERVKVYLVNQAKWAAARAHAEAIGGRFVVMTEKEIFPGQGSIKPFRPSRRVSNVKRSSRSKK